MKSFHSILFYFKASKINSRRAGTIATLQGKWDFLVITRIRVCEDYQHLIHKKGVDANLLSSVLMPCGQPDVMDSNVA